MFKFVCIVLLASTSLAARLDTSYLPPRVGSGTSAGAYNAGGSGAPGFPSGGSSFPSGGGSSGPQIPILKYDNVNNGDGNYRYSYETGNGIQAEEQGSPRAPGPEGPAVTSQGSYSYTAPDGQRITVTYTADENGFHPSGAHLPTPPPIPDAILKSIQFNAQNPSSDNSGQYNPALNGGGTSSGTSGNSGTFGSGGYRY